MRRILLGLVLLCMACGTDPQVTDGADAASTPPDASSSTPPDASEAPDAGPADAADMPDASSADASSDAAIAPDASTAPDAGSSDAGASDGGPTPCQTMTGTPSWALENLGPTDSSYRRIFARAANDLVVLSPDTAANRHWDGMNFQPLPATGTVAFTLGQDDYLLGYAQGVRRVKNGVATDYPLGGEVLDVHGFDAQNVYAVGKAGLLQKFDGTSWAAVNTGLTITRDLTSVFARNASDIWVGYGAASATDTDVLLHFDGTSWKAATKSQMNLFNTPGAVVSIYVPDQFKAYFCIDNTNQLTIYSGGAWSRNSLNFSSGCRAISGVSATDMFYVSGQGGIGRFNGSGITAINTQNPPKFTRTVHAFAAGQAAFAGDLGQVFLFNAAANPTLKELSWGIHEDLRFIWAAPTGESYTSKNSNGSISSQNPGPVCGQCGRWFQPPGFGGLGVADGAIYGTSASKVWYTTQGGVVKVTTAPFKFDSPYDRFSSAGLTEMIGAAVITGGTPNPVTYVEGRKTANGFKAIYMFNGTTWVDVTPNTWTKTFDPIREINRLVIVNNEAFVKQPEGTYGNVLRHNRSSMPITYWGPESIGVTSDIKDLVDLKNGEILALTNPTQDSRIRDSSGVWRSAGFATGLPVFQRASALSNTDIYAVKFDDGVDTRGFLWHFDGNAWTEVAQVGKGRLVDVHAASKDEIVAVGDYGRVWRFGRR